MGLPLPSLDALPLGAHRFSSDDAAAEHAVHVLTDPELFAHCNTYIAFTQRAGGVSLGPYASLNCASHVGDDPSHVECNRLRVCNALNLEPEALLVPKQVHGTDLVIVRGAHEVPVARAKAGRGADGIVVSANGVGALLNFADCLPLVIVAPDGAFAVVHAGWRGALAHIAQSACEELARTSGCEPAQFNAYIGPHIRSECFEVGEDLAHTFEAEFGCDAAPDASHVSLADAVSCDLMRAGLEERRIVDACVCTCCNPDRYYSYRASGGTCGRHSALAVRYAGSHDG